MTIGIRREDLSKTGEKRVAITPTTALPILASGHRILLQPGIHPQSQDNKRAFSDLAYQQSGVEISESLAEAEVVFGLKEVGIDYLLPKKTYLFFSHTHKGQIKNRPLLKAMMEKQISLIDYELIVDEAGRRLVTAFTYFAGYAGMTDSLWTLGKRWKMRGIDSPFANIPQSIEREDLALIRQDIQAAGQQIAKIGTPASQPPVIIVILGTGKTSQGSQSMLAHLPIESISLHQLKETFLHGDRKKVYQCVLEVSDMFRWKSDSPYDHQNIDDKNAYAIYLREPQYFESNLDQIFPYATILMNCILWGPDYPRLLTRDDAEIWWNNHKTLEVIGDITCDPEGAIQFSKETWINDPVFVYNPENRSSTNGLGGQGIAVMAVTNLPCEFPGDASEQFSSELSKLIVDVTNADHGAESPEAAGLPEAIRKATILWKGKLTEPYLYMQAYLE